MTRVKAKRSKLVYLHTKGIIEITLLLSLVLPCFFSVRVEMMGDTIPN